MSRSVSINLFLINSPEFSSPPSNHFLLPQMHLKKKIIPFLGCKLPLLTSSQNFLVKSRLGHGTIRSAEAKAMISSYSPHFTSLASIDDVERNAKEILPKGAIGYYWGGTAEEQTLARNRKAFKRYLIRPFTMRDVSQLDASVHLKLTSNGKSFERTLPYPLGIAPTAFQAMAHSEGEKATARASGKTGTIFICSSYSNYSLDEIAKAAPEGTSLWFQVSMCKDRSMTESLVKRAVNAGVQALVVTGDPVTELRIRNNVRNGFMLPAHLRAPNFEALIAQKNGGNAGDMANVRQHSLSLIDDSLTWEVLIKGVLRPEDAERAIQAGVAGIIVSNLGGRSLDHGPSTIEALAEISATVKGRIPLFMDGGIRSGTDIFKAIAFGAQTVFIGRPVLFGLAVGGEEGVNHVIALLRRELENAMKLSGCSTLAQIRNNRQMVVHESYYSKF